MIWWKHRTYSPVSGIITLSRIVRGAVYGFCRPTHCRMKTEKYFGVVPRRNRRNNIKREGSTPCLAAKGGGRFGGRKRRQRMSVFYVSDTQGVASPLLVKASHQLGPCSVSSTERISRYEREDNCSIQLLSATPISELAHTR